MGGDGGREGGGWVEGKEREERGEGETQRALLRNDETIQNWKEEFSIEFPREREREGRARALAFPFFSVLERCTRRVVFCFSHLHFHLFVIIHGRHD